MDLSIIILNFNTQKLTLNCINSVINHAREISYEIILIDNGSNEPGSISKFKNLKKYSQIKTIVNETNLGFGKANNQGLKIAKGRYVLFLNSDTIIDSNLFAEMVAWMDKNKNVGISTCALRNSDGSLQGSGGYFPTLLRVFSWMTIQDIPFVDNFIRPFHPMKDKMNSAGGEFYRKEKSVDWITGAFMMARNETINQIKGFDEDYFMYGEDVDLCYRAKMMGWEIRYLPQWSIVHLGGKSGTKERTIINEFLGIKTFYKKHCPKWQFNLLRVFLILGVMLRIIAYGLFEGKEAAHIYAKALRSI